MLILKLLKNKRVRQLLVRRLVELVGVLVVAAAAVVVHGQAKDARGEAWQAVHTLEQLPENTRQLEAVRRTYEEQADTLETISALVPAREEIGRLITVFERSARENDVTLQIPEVLEQVLRDERGKELEWTGPGAQVSIRFRASGSPNDVLVWLYAVEHLPYLLRSVEWRLTLGESLQPGFVPPAEGPGGETPPSDSALLEGRLILTIQNDG